jgi:membrane protein DedA with SNARE-associated domain
MFDSLLDLVGGSPWAYAAIFAIVTIDAFFPLVPGETSVITGAILAANDHLSVLLVFAAAMAGALAGDNISYLLGDRFGPSVQRRMFKTDKAAKKLAWARRQLQERGPVIIIAARFVPGGRTAATFSAGALEYRWRTFIAAAVAAAVLWASFTTALGWFGGNAYKDSLWKPLLISFAVAVLAAGAGELYRRATDHPEPAEPVEPGG